MRHYFDGRDNKNSGRASVCSLLLTLFLFSASQAQERISSTINSDWLFTKVAPTKEPAAANWEHVSLPHTWNAQDAMDDVPGYYQGDGWYKKTIFVPVGWKEKDVYILFEGAAQIAEVFVNGKPVGRHIGSYNRFSFPIGGYLNYDPQRNQANEILVKVNNSNNEKVPPLSGDFNFYGGIYRDVYLDVLNKIHFDADNHASSGVFITTPVVDERNAAVSVKGAFVNGDRAKRSLLVSHKIIDATGKLLAEQTDKFEAAPGQKTDFAQEIRNIKGHRLWSVEDPYLYRVVSTITDAATNQKLDEVNNPLGFRWYEFDANKGFFLNGKPVKLIGTSRHQDFKGMGNALPDALHVRDVELVKEMGGNFLRIAHYPQDPAILQACDRLGILASVETPIVNGIAETEEFSKNARDMHLEMIRQNFNHPSLIIWAYMNEVLLRPLYGQGTEKQELYFKAVTKLAQELEDITRREDPYRYTLIPCHGNFDLYNKVQLTRIPKLVGWNLYAGWYYGAFEDFGKFLDRHHQELPDKPVLVTEYGADVDGRLHSFAPARYDKTVEFANDYHRAYLRAIKDRPFVGAAVIWNLAEFGAEHRAEVPTHVNGKGLLTFDRKPKDGYRFYQANLLKTPWVQIGSKEWAIRTGFASSETNPVSTQPVFVFSNQSRVTLRLNGKEVGSAATDQGVAKFDVPFTNGHNRLQAVAMAGGVEVTDQSDVTFKMLSQNLRSQNVAFGEMNISLGDKRYYYDELLGQTWIPEQEYRQGSWGYVGGKVFVEGGRRAAPYGSGKNILGTDLDPIYQTQRVGIEQFRFDVQDGEYEITLHFAELLSPVKPGEQVYNLGGGATPVEFKERSFNVSVDGTEVITGLSNGEYLHPERAVATKLAVTARDNRGITIDFKALKGETILNGIQIRKVR